MSSSRLTDKQRTWIKKQRNITQKIIPVLMLIVFVVLSACGVIYAQSQTALEKLIVREPIVILLIILFTLFIVGNYARRFLAIIDYLEEKPETNRG